MGFFGSEFVDVRSALGGVGDTPTMLLTPSDIKDWSRSFPNGMTLYFAPGRYLLRRVKTTYGLWTADYDFPVGCDLWMDSGAELVFETARVLIRGNIIAPLTRIFRQETGVDERELAANYAELSGMVLIASNLPAVYPEWWGASAVRTPLNDRAIHDAIMTASTLRNPATTTKVASSGGFGVQRDFRAPLPPLPVVFSQLYPITSSVVGGGDLRLANVAEMELGTPVHAMDFGRSGYTTVILRGVRRGARLPETGLRYEGRENAERAVLHLKNSYGATVENLVVDGGDRAGVGVYVEPTVEIPQMHSVLLRRNHVSKCTRTAVQVGPVASRVADRSAVRVSVREVVGSAPRDTIVTVPSIPTGRDDGWLDVPGLQIDQCQIECGHTTEKGIRPTLGIQLRAANGVANLVTGCRFRGHATAFVEAVATYSLIERCDFANLHYERGPQETPFLHEAGADGIEVGPLGFEPPKGSDVYLGLDPVLLAAGTQTGTTSVVSESAIVKPPTEGVVLMHSCISTSLSMFATVRPGIFDYKRSERANMILGCVHRVDANHFMAWSDLERSRLPTSVSWGRRAYSAYRKRQGSPGYNPDPCFTCVGNHLENGVEVYYGAPQCALVSIDTRADVVPRYSDARRGIRRVTFIFGLAMMLTWALAAAGCVTAASGTDAGATPPADDIQRDTAALDAGPPEDTTAVMDVKLEVEMDVRADVRSDVFVNRRDLPDDFPEPDIPGVLPIDGYPPPSQQRHNCPALMDGDPAIPAPRLVGPMSPLRMTSQRPTLRWALAPGLTGAQIELCRDPCCQQVITTLRADGDRVRPDRPLAQGVVFWRARGMVGSRVGRDTSFTWEFGVPHRDSTIDTFKGPIHDFNGDGFDDVVLSIRGGIRVYWGGQGGLAEERYTDYRLARNATAYNVVGDVNADGFADVIASYQVFDLMTREFYVRMEVLNGTTSGLTSDSPDHIVAALRPGLGDINGDGFSDLTVGRYRHVDSWEIRSLTQLFGGRQGVGVGGMRRVVDPARTIAPQHSASFGSSSVVGDADGDGYADAVIGAPKESDSSGVIYAYRGGLGGLASTPEVRIPSRITAPRRSVWGVRLFNIGDINLDGLADFHVAAEGGGIPVFHGSTQGLLSYAYTAHVVSYADTTQIWSAAATDLDGDGSHEGYWGCTLCFVESEEGPDYINLGRVIIVRGTLDGPSVERVQAPPYPDGSLYRSRYFGDGVTAVDVDGDGWDDLVTLDPEVSRGPNQFPRGRISVFFGGPGFLGRSVHFIVRHGNDGAVPTGLT